MVKVYAFTTFFSLHMQAAGTDKQGTSVYGLIKAAEKLGVIAKRFTMVF